MLSKEKILEYLREQAEEANKLAYEAIDKRDVLEYAHKGERADTYREILVFLSEVL